MTSLRMRQIHLDFHTSAPIGAVGEAFDGTRFAETLRRAHVNHVNLFAKCHHGFSYHDTRVGTRHPGLRFDLLRAQVDACTAADITVQIYVSAGWDELMMHRRPDWRRVGADGQFVMFNGRNLEAAWAEACFNTGYLPYLCDQIAEAARLFPEAVGFWLDILHQDDCCCPVCRDEMDARGLDWTRPEDRRIQSVATRQKYLAATMRAARTVRADMPVFHNMGHLPRGDRSLQPYFSHWELESLPTGGWGYDHFPLSASFARRLGKPYLGMTGKFHTMWGEFGGFKTANALRYEAAQMLAFGAAVSIGDQLHPTGALEEPTYRFVGEAFAEVEAKEPWCAGRIEPVVDVAVYSHQGLVRPGQTDMAARHDAEDAGAGRVLLEEHHLFDVIDDAVPFDGYRLVIFPDDIPFDDALAARVRSYLDAGGRVLLTGASGLRPDGGGPALDLGAEWGGASPFAPDFVLPDPALRSDGLSVPMVVYGGSQRLRPTTGRSLGQVFDPYFNRTPRHFCSHQHSPPRPVPSGFAAGVAHGRLATLAHPVFRSYRETGAVFLRRWVGAVIDMMLADDRTLRTSLPSIGRATLNRQPDEARLVLHLLYAPLASRGTWKGRPIEVIEDLPTVTDVAVSVRCERPVRRVRLVPEGIDLPFRAEEGRIAFTIDRFACHRMVEIS